MRLIDKNVVHTNFVKHDPIILLVLGEQVFQPFAAGGLLLLDGLDEIAVGSLGPGMFAEQLVIFRDLLK